MIISDEEKKITAVHEAGHALLSVLLPHADDLHKVTIIREAWRWASHNSCRSTRNTTTRAIT